MSTRRVPLANVPNATNSPFRGAAAGNNKRTRSQATDSKDLPYGQAPPAKKQAIEAEDRENRPAVLARHRASKQTFQQKFEAVYGTKPPSVTKATEKTQKPADENLETIRQWQRHYKKAFPAFVFYFESVPEEVRSKLSRQVQSLGAREEKFFSRIVTHVVTTRSIPQELATSSTEVRTSSSVTAVNGNNAQHASTINPKLLRAMDALKAGSLFDAAAQKKMLAITQQTAANDALSQKIQAANGDILYKARELGMKIWALEKINRMMNTMFNTETGEHVVLTHNTRAASVAPSKAARGNDLSRLLKNEKIHGPADRDPTVATEEMIEFRGTYLFVHDMDEKTRPVMIRDYKTPGTDESGSWPQFRMSGLGKCPFLEDPHHTKKLREKEAQQKAAERAANAPRTRAASSALEASKQVAPAGRRVLTENNNLARRSNTVPPTADPKGTSAPLDPPKTIPAKRPNLDSLPPLFGSTQANLRQMPRFVGGEPVASGVQPSNITSAIKSQMISSTAAAPGARAGTSKEVHHLQRKVLEKNSAPSANSNPSSFMNDMRAALNNDRVPLPRQAKKKAQEGLTNIHEDMTPSEEEAQVKKAAAQKQSKKEVVEREPKAGYCENCRDKFDDFDEHVKTKKHRKFATDDGNWQELDQLLAKLQRPSRSPRFHAAAEALGLDDV